MVSSMPASWARLILPMKKPATSGEVDLAQQCADLFLIVAGGVDDVVFQLLIGLHVQHAEYHMQLVHKFVRLHPEHRRSAPCRSAAAAGG